MNRMARQDIINLAKNIVVFYCNKRYFNDRKINKNDVDILKCSRKNNIRTIKLSVVDDDKIRYFKVKYDYYTESTSTYEYKTLGKVRKKKNFEKLENALDILENIDIYKYHLKKQNESEKKHIGFVIGEDFKYSEEVTSQENDSVDIYSFVSVCCKAIKELQEEILELKKEMKK